MEKEQTFKMSKMWVKRFVDVKKIKDGWRVIDNPDNTQVILKPNGSIFALFEKETGFVHTTVNIKDIQW